MVTAQSGDGGGSAPERPSRLGSVVSAGRLGKRQVYNMVLQRSRAPPPPLWGARSEDYTRALTAKAERTRTQAGGESIAPSTPGLPGADDELAPATLIDRYEIQRRLGAGGMGVVYAARDIHLGRAVAIKVVGPRIEAGSGQDRLAREAQAMARLRHPNLATVYDIGVSQGRLFVVMELVDGGTAADWLRAAPRSWQAILALYLQAARGLAAAHAAGFVHRDFKPENVLVGKDGVARVADFGVARLLGDTDGANPEGAAQAAAGARTGVVGTPGYIAPEILRQQPVDGRSDQFSLCVALYGSLYGEPPFERLEGADRSAETLGTPRPPRAGVGPRWLQRFIARGLAADPRDRWPTIEALTAAIERRLALRRRALVLAGVGAAALAAAATATALRATPVQPADWSPVAIGREDRDSPLDLAVSRDGSTLVGYSSAEAWTEPRAGGPRRRAVFPSPARLVTCRPSRTGDRLACSLDLGLGRLELWTLDVATGQAARRIPSAAAPGVDPGALYDLGPDESILFGDVACTGVWRLDPAGAVVRVATAGSGELLTGAAWSPDGTRIALRVRSLEGARVEILTASSGAVRVVSHRICKDLEWLSEDSLACGPRRFQNPVVIELLLPAGGGEARERVRYNGPEYHQLGGLAASSEGVLFSTAPNHKHLALVPLGAPGRPRRISSGGITDLPAAGWTASGLLIFGASAQGHLRIMALRPDGRVETVRIGPAAEVPLAVLGETVLFGRFPGGESTIPFFETPFGRKYPEGELYRLTLPGGAVEPLGETHGFSELLCAGGRAPTCLLAERAGREVIAIDWDPVTGARGRERARWQMTSYASQSALSPDGRTLAQVRRVLGRVELSLLDLESGARRRLPVAGTSLDFPRWLPDGALLAMGSSTLDRGIVRLRGEDGIESVASVFSRDEPLSLAEDFQVAADGKTAAVLMTEPLRTFWWAPRPREP